MAGPRRTIAGYFDNALQVVAKARLHIILALVIFCSALVAGAVMSERFAWLVNYLAAFAEGLRDKSTAGIIIGIFRKNAIAMLVVLLGGIAFGAVPVFALVMNGALIGVVMMQSLDQGLNILLFLAAVIPHGMFELPAFFIASGVSMRIGFMQFRRKGREPARTRMAEGMQVLLCIVLPLLLVAAVIEGASMAHLR